MISTPTTPKQWCALTGWPLAEWMDLSVTDAHEILNLYGLGLTEEARILELGYRTGYSDALDEVSRIMGMER